MKNDTANLFIPISPSHIVNFELLLKSIGDNGKKNILLNPAGFKHKEELWDEVILDNIKLTSNEVAFFKKALYQTKKIRQTKKYIKQTKNSLKSYNELSLFYCNLEDVLTNYFFFKYQSNKIVDKTLVEDGVLNYYNYKVEDKKSKQFKLKSLLGFLFKVPFTNFKGNVTGIDFNSVTKQYVRTPELAVRADKAVQLPYPKIEYTPSKSKVLFIGQDIIANLIGKTQYIEKVNQYFESIIQIVGNDNVQVIYKPHRNGDYNLIKPLGEKHFGSSFRFYLDSTPVEEAVKEVTPSHIFTFSSSGIINIKLALVETVDVCFYASPITTTPQLLSLFKKFNIEIVK